jgi:NitT/TauT family transport system substrate-binding protein
MKKVVLFLSLIMLISCTSRDKKLNKVSLRFDWIPTMSFAGDIVGMNKYDSINGINLKLEAAGEGIDPIKMVISGQNTFGIVGVDKLLMANEKGANLVALGIVDNVSPTVFMSIKSKNILTPYDFIGKKVGIQSGGATEFVYRSLIKKLNIDRNKINEVQIGFDMKPFIENEYDVRPGFIFDEAVYLEINNIEYNLIEPNKYGLFYPGRVYFTKKETIDRYPELVQGFINTVASGWEYALKNPEEAIDELKAFEPKINYERELRGLIKAKSYFSGYNNKILDPDLESINEMIKSLCDLGILKNNISSSSIFNLSFITNYSLKSNARTK